METLPRTTTKKEASPLTIFVIAATLYILWGAVGVFSSDPSALLFIGVFYWVLLTKTPAMSWRATLPRLTLPVICLYFPAKLLDYLGYSTQATAFGTVVYLTVAPLLLYKYFTGAFNPPKSPAANEPTPEK